VSLKGHENMNIFKSFERLIQSFARPNDSRERHNNNGAECYIIILDIALDYCILRWFFTARKYLLRKKYLIIKSIFFLRRYFLVVKKHRRIQ